MPRYLAEFEYRFNRRYDLGAIIPRLAFVALRTAPMPYRFPKLAGVAAQSGNVLREFFGTEEWRQRAIGRLQVY